MASKSTSISFSPFVNRCHGRYRISRLKVKLSCFVTIFSNNLKIVALFAYCLGRSGRLFSIFLYVVFENEDATIIRVGICVEVC